MRGGDAGKLSVLMFTAFIDMVGALMIIPLLPFYAKRFGASDFAVMALVASFSAMQLISAPLWGRVSDRYGRKARAAVRAWRIDDRVHRVRVRGFVLAALRVAHHPGRGRRHDGRDPGVRRGQHGAEGSRARARLALVGDECGRGDRARDRIVLAQPRPALAGDDRRAALRARTSSSPRAICRSRTTRRRGCARAAGARRSTPCCAWPAWTSGSRTRGSSGCTPWGSARSTA